MVKIFTFLADILKHTPKSNPDAKKLEEALRAIKEVMTYINEDKRKTEGQLAMFDIFNDIDNCPVSKTHYFCFVLLLTGMLCKFFIAPLFTSLVCFFLIFQMRNFLSKTH